MKTKTNGSFTFLKSLACAAIAMGAVALAHAQDTKLDPSGLWAWTNPGRNGNGPTTNVLVLKWVRPTLTGTLKAPGRNGKTNEMEISDGSLEGSEISFKVTREVGGNTMTMKYHGTLSSDKITGKIDSERDGQTRSRKWEATRTSAEQ